MQSTKLIKYGSNTEEKGKGTEHGYKHINFYPKHLKKLLLRIIKTERYPFINLQEQTSKTCPCSHTRMQKCFMQSDKHCMMVWQCLTNKDRFEKTKHDFVSSPIEEAKHNFVYSPIKRQNITLFLDLLRRQNITLFLVLSMKN